MTTYQPKIDIVIAALNEEQSIGKCLQCLNAQNYPGELVTVYVVVDGRTTDDTANVAACHGANVIGSDGTGIAFVRNLGFAQGSGELVGFLDAHCFPEPEWIAAMVAPFEDPMVGGCQGNLQSICDSPVVQRFLSQSFFSSDQRMIEHTVEGRFSPYPWVIGGNSMFRRRAIDDAGPSTECPCDDVDRSWKVFLQGYLLVHAPVARSLHHDHATIGAYLRKRFSMGVGAAQLAYAYGYAGRRKRGDRRYPRTLEVTLIDLIYGCGYLSEQLRQRQGVIALPKRTREPVQRRFRPRFSWSAHDVLQISPDVVFWPVAEECVLCVHLLNGTRMVFDGVANVIFRQLIAAGNKSETCAAIAEQFNAEVDSIENDVNEFIESLRKEGLINVLAKSADSTSEPHVAAPAAVA